MSTFSTVRSEGGILPMQVLERAAQDRLPGMSKTDYGLPPYAEIGEEVSAAWAKATRAWRHFQTERIKWPEGADLTGVTRQAWLLPLLECLGFGRVATTTAQTIDGRVYPVSHRWGRSPIHLLGARLALDTRTQGATGASRSSPHGMVQAYLNRTDDLWGMVSNGLQLRLLRDHESLTRLAYVEFDLEAMMEGRHFSDFRLLWLTCHPTRFAVSADGRPADCFLEQWFSVVREEGLRALETLRDGVEQAIAALGAGFVAHRDNSRLRDALKSGVLDKQEYYRQLLRLAYRLIFIFVAEDRELLFDPGAPRAARTRYARWYSTRTTRTLARTRMGSSHTDRWQGIQLVMRALNAGSTELALPALASFLWGPEATPWLDDAVLTNRSLYAALRPLCYTRDGDRLFPVNWRNIGAQELGSVYESLLERHPKIDPVARTFTLESAAGNERKTTGSYYTPDGLVACLLDSALEPVIADARREGVAALLALKICDPACGSGHFLVAAARRLALEVARARTDDESPAPPDVQAAMRDVVGRCIYGVDINPMAVELCKVSLWMEAMTPGKPLSFLDAHIRCGNALLGTTPALLSRGIPDAAFKPIEGDDKAFSTLLRKRNRAERKAGKKQMALLGGDWADAQSISTARKALDDIDDEDLAGVERKRAAWRAFVDSDGYRAKKLAADLWCAAFLWRKTEDAEADGRVAPTQSIFETVAGNAAGLSDAVRAEVDAIAEQYGLFHWHLAFPEVFGTCLTIAKDDPTGWAGGFDVVLGNPPWERIKLQEKEFFATRHAGIATARNKAARTKLITALEAEDPVLLDAWHEAKREAEGASHLVRDSGRFPLCGRGDVNTYSVFSEHNRQSIAGSGRTGFIVPTGIATDHTTRFFFRALVESRTLAAMYGFENEEHIFKDVHNAFKFALLVITGAERTVPEADLVFFARQVEDLLRPERHFVLGPDDFELLNPNTRTCPTFRWQRDARITKAIYRKLPVLEVENEPAGNPWSVSFQAMFHMSGDSGSFLTAEQMSGIGARQSGNCYDLGAVRYLPLYEAKMVHHFDHRFGTYDGQTQAQANKGFLPYSTPEDHADASYAVMPRYWVSEQAVEARLRERWDRGWQVSVRKICRTVDRRTVISSIIPTCGFADSGFVVFASLPRAWAVAQASLSSFVFDYAARTKLGGSNLNFFVLKQLPLLPPTRLSASCRWETGSVETWLRPRVLELTYTAWDLEAFGGDCDYEGPPFRWDEDRRFLLRCELDAAFFHLYGVAKDDVDYIMDSFWIVRDRDAAAHGNYRTKETILTVYDALQTAIDTGVPYQTQLSPPPADPSVAHPPRVSVAAPVDLENLDVLPAGAWATSNDQQHILQGVALIAALKIWGKVPAMTIRDAVGLILEPSILLPHLSSDEAAHWARLVGPAAATRTDGVARLSTNNHAWRKAVTQLLGVGQLVEDEGTWAPGPGLDSRFTGGWADGRAAFVQRVMQRRGVRARIESSATTQGLRDAMAV